MVSIHSATSAAFSKWKVYIFPCFYLLNLFIFSLIHLPIRSFLGLLTYFSFVRPLVRSFANSFLMASVLVIRSIAWYMRNIQSDAMNHNKHDLFYQILFLQWPMTLHAPQKSNFRPLNKDDIITRRIFFKSFPISRPMFASGTLVY